MAVIVELLATWPAASNVSWLKVALIVAVVETRPVIALVTVSRVTEIAAVVATVPERFAVRLPSVAVMFDPLAADP